MCGRSAGGCRAECENVRKPPKAFGRGRFPPASILLSAPPTKNPRSVCGGSHQSPKERLRLRHPTGGRGACATTARRGRRRDRAPKRTVRPPTLGGGRKARDSQGPEPPPKPATTQESRHIRNPPKPHQTGHSRSNKIGAVRTWGLDAPTDAIDSRIRTFGAVGQEVTEPLRKRSLVYERASPCVSVQGGAREW